MSIPGFQYIFLVSVHAMNQCSDEEILKSRSSFKPGMQLKIHSVNKSVKSKPTNTADRHARLLLVPHVTLNLRYFCFPTGHIFGSCGQSSFRDFMGGASHCYAQESSITYFLA